MAYDNNPDNNPGRDGITAALMKIAYGGGGQRPTGMQQLARLPAIGNINQPQQPGLRPAIAPPSGPMGPVGGPQQPGLNLPGLPGNVVGGALGLQPQPNQAMAQPDIYGSGS